MINLDVYGIEAIDTSCSDLVLQSAHSLDVPSERLVPKRGFPSPDSRRESSEFDNSERIKGSPTDQHDDPVDLDHSCLLDVHRWSDHPEVSSLCNEVIKGFLPESLTKKQVDHLRLVLLNLYVAWCEDPKLTIAFERRYESFTGPARYNRLWIKRSILETIDLLAERGLIGTKLGFFDRREGGSSRTSRMWPKKPLLEMFERARLSTFDIGWTEDRETVILRITVKDPETKKRVVVDIDYEETEETIRRRLFLTEDYNPLLQRTFISIPELTTGFVDLGKDSKGGTKRIRVSQSQKFVRCVYSQGSLQKGGRFFGGSWQRLPKEWRQKLYIDDKPTVEIDFSGHHVVLLYAGLQIDYWRDINANVYEVETPSFLDSPEETKRCVKILMLIALNAKDEKATFSAFRQSFETGDPFRRLTDEQLKVVLDSLREKHSPIGQFFASSAGIDLMNTDSKITEVILRHFTEKGITCLSVHDSYIVQIEHEAELKQVMEAAFRTVAGVDGVNMKREMGDQHQIRARRYVGEYLAFRNWMLKELAA